jgi:hypothetical protein
MTRPRHEGWRLALNLALTAAVGGLLFALIGAWLAAGITFGAGILCAAAAWLLSQK